MKCRHAERDDYLDAHRREPENGCGRVQPPIETRVLWLPRDGNFNGHDPVRNRRRFTVEKAYGVAYPGMKRAEEPFAMCTPAQLRQMITARPFQPFLVKMASGRTFTVRHPENASCDPDGRAMTVYEGKDMHLIEMLLVEDLVPETALADSSGGSA
jgi:hypothetical protein